MALQPAAYSGHWQRRGMSSPPWMKRGLGSSILTCIPWSNINHDYSFDIFLVLASNTVKKKKKCRTLLDTFLLLWLSGA